MEQTKLSQNKQKKQSIVTEVTAKVQKAKGMVFTNYQGLTHQQLEGFKKAIKPLEAEYFVAKNTLLLRSLKDKNLTEDDKQHFQQPTGTLFIFNDPIEPLKQLTKLIKAFKLPVIKFGILEDRSINADQIEKLSTLPPLPVLRAQLLGQMQGPISGLHRALNWNLQKLVMTLHAVQHKKS